MSQDPLSEINLKSAQKPVKERQFKGLSLAERKQARREKLIEAGIQAYGTHGFFSVTVKDICNQAKLTERYFYESFQKSEQLFQSIFLKQIEILQSTMMQAIVQASPNPRKMVTAGLSALFNLLKNDPRLARIIYIDATLVQELHKQAIIRETMNKFDRMIQAFVMSLMPQIPQAEQEISLVATGLNGYVTQVARRWVIGEFKQSQDEIVAACELVFIALIEKFIP
ncbi:TetR/AcrR family transcriptional regulator [Acinetobacter pullicarnis]|uniref:TetR/AcrR family transcriptional regulator n=1 Tax=Acinetobacter pullicarnis TaxID=2576829 RepID=UPI00112102BC|nr:TetR family transcriptional regulator [Acinetobacter pullicarnis]